MKGLSRAQVWLRAQWQSDGAWSMMMRPLAWLYSLACKRRRARYLTGASNPYRCKVPVIVVGNIYVGGTGKTPIICDLAEQLCSQGWQPGLVSRGYGRQETAQPVVGRCDLDWRLFGDEPTLIAKRTLIPVSVAANRALAAQTLLEAFPQVDVILSDDGLQHYRLERDIELLVEDERGTGNGQLLPAGPLREPADRRTQVDAILKRGASRCPEESPRFGHDRPENLPPIWSFSVETDLFWCPATNQSLSTEAFIQMTSTHQPVLALAGIGVPERFFDGLRRSGLKLDTTWALADHAALDANWLDRDEAATAGTILMTEKDAVKCGELRDSRVWVAKASVRWHQSGFFEWLSKRLLLVAPTLSHQQKTSEV